MSSLRRIRGMFRRLLGLFQKPAREAEMAAEMQQHLDRLAERNLARGMAPDEARYAAARAFGGVEQHKERARDERGLNWIEHLCEDLRHGARMLRRHPRFTTVAVLTLALSLGATTAMFSIVNTSILHPFPYPRPDQLVVIRWYSIPSQRTLLFSPDEYAYYQRRATVFSSLGAVNPILLEFVGADEPQRVVTQQVSANFLSVLGVAPMLGRDFLPEDQIQGKTPVIILGYQLWLEHFGGRPDIVGRKALLDDVPVTIIGVMPGNFQRSEFGGPDVYMPIMPPAPNSVRVTGNRYMLVGRLRDHATLAQAQAEMASLEKNSPRAGLSPRRERSMVVTTLAESVLGFAHATLLTLFGAVVCLHLIASANIASLLLVRSSARRKEIVARLALGASRARVTRQLFCENLLLVLPAGALGIALAWVALKLIPWVLPADLPRAGEITVDATVLWFSGAATLLTGLGFGLLPALFGTRVDLSSALKGSQGLREGNPAPRLSSALITAVVAIAVILLFGAGELVRSYFQYEYTDLGFTRKSLHWTRLGLPEKKYADAASQLRFATQALRHLSAVPGVSSAFFIHGGSLPFTGGTRFLLADGPAKASGGSVLVTFGSVTHDYAKTLGLPLRGRAFTLQDETDAHPVVLISEEMARQYFPKKNPIGQHLLLRSEAGAWVRREIVGVVGNVRFKGDGDWIRPHAYIPFSQAYSPSLDLWIRMMPGVPADFPEIRRALRAVEPEATISGLRDTGPEQRGVSAVQRFAMVCSVAFSFIAVLLGITGVFSLLSFNLIQRTGEIGIRIALGARRRDVLRLLLGIALRPVGFGLLLGIVGVLATAGVMEGFPFEVKPYDPVTFIGVTLVIGLAGLVACWWPARRAVQVNPMVALRCE
jgi:predicted permease